MKPGALFLRPAEVELLPLCLKNPASPGLYSQFRSQRLQGFTIIEIMLAITIFGMILVAIYSSWSAILRSTQIGMAAAAEVQRTRIAMRALEESLASAELYADNARFYSFLADTSGDFAALSFVARLPASFPGSGLFQGQNVRRVTFTVEAGKNSPAQLVLTQTPILEATEMVGEPYSIVLSRDLNLFGLEFWDARTNGWVGEWLFTNQLPRLVKVALGFGKKRGFQTQPQDIAMRVVSLTGNSIGRFGAGRPPVVAPGRPVQGRPPVQGGGSSRQLNSQRQRNLPVQPGGRNPRR